MEFLNPILPGGGGGPNAHTFFSAQLLIFSNSNDFSYFVTNFIMILWVLYLHFDCANKFDESVF